MFAASAPGGSASAVPLTSRITAVGSSREEVRGFSGFGSGARSIASTATRSRARVVRSRGALWHGKTGSPPLARTRAFGSRASRGVPVARADAGGPTNTGGATSSSEKPKVSPEFRCPRLTETRELVAHVSPFAEGGEKHGFGLGQKFVADDDCVLLNALRYEALECEGNPNAEACELNFLDDDGRDPDAWRTRLCGEFEQYGNCSRGDACTYAHGENELRHRGSELWPMAAPQVSPDSLAWPPPPEQPRTPERTVGPGA